MCDDWIEEEDRAPLSYEQLAQPKRNHFEQNNGWADNTSHKHYGNREPRGRGNYRGNRGRGGRGRGNMRRNGPPDNQVPIANGQPMLTFQIAQRDVGKLIGTKGCNINRIKQETQCSIDIGGENPEVNRSVDIHIRGDGEDLRAKCRAAIEKHLGYSSLGNPDSDQEDEPIDWGSLADDETMKEKKRWAKSVPLNKNFYVEHDDVKTLSQAQVKEFREENNQIKVYNFNKDSSDPLLNPVGAFHHAFEPYPEIMDTINRQGFEKPSPIQAQAWPYLLSGKVKKTLRIILFVKRQELF